MHAASSIWSSYVTRLFGTTRPRGRTRLRHADFCRRQHAPVFCAAEVMEERALLSATFDAALSIGNDAGTTRAIDVAADAAGNSYITGVFSGTVDFDQGATQAGDTLTSSGPQDIYVARYAPDNSLVWVQRLGGDDGSVNPNEKGNRIAVDGGGNVYVTGGFVGAGDFGSTTLTSTGSTDGFVVKLDSAGTVQWARSWGGDHGLAGEAGFGDGVGVDSSGNVYVAGPSLGFGYDFKKFSSTGNLAWSKSIATIGASFGDLAVEASGNLYYVNSFSGTVDFDPGPKPVRVSSTGTSAFALKLTSNGNFGWVTPFVGQTVGSSTGSAWGRSLALDGSGNVIVGGDYGGAVDFNPGKGVTTLPTTGGGYVAKLNSSGGLVWAKATGGLTKGLDVDSAGSIYVTGGFGGTADFDPGAGVQARTAAGVADIFVLKLTSAGNFSWVETFGGAGDDRGAAIAVDPAGYIHVAGYFQDTVDFDPDPFATYDLTGPVPSSNYWNAFRLRLRQV